MFDSKEEEYFSHWVSELKNKGFIRSYERCMESFLLFEQVDTTWHKKTSRTNDNRSFTLLNSVSYTPDFKIEWAEKAEGLMCFTENTSLKKRTSDLLYHIDLVTYVDVKGSFFGKHNSDILFPMKRAAMYHVHNLYVEKVQPLSGKSKGLFEKTFCPKDYVEDVGLYVRGKKKGLPKIKHKITYIDEYIERKKNQAIGE